MNLSKQGNMFTESSIGENVGEIKDEPSVADVDYGIGQLSVSPLVCERAGESPVNMSMVLSDDSDDLLSSAFDFLDFDFHSEQMDDVAEDTTKAEALGLVCDDGRYANKFDSSDSIILPEPSIQGDGEEKILGEIEENHKSNLSLTGQTSSQGGVHSDESNRTNKSQKASRSRRRMAGNKSVVDLSSLQILRRKRSLFVKRGRSSVWGSVGHIFPDIEQCSGLNPNTDNEEKPRRSRVGQRNRNVVKDQKARKSTVKKCTPAGRISLKIRIGNQSCTIGNLTESVNASEKNPVENTESKLGDKIPGDMLSPHKLNLEKTVSSGTCLLNAGTVENPSFGTSFDHLPIVSHEEGAPPDNICSDPGTSPDSEVINSAPDALSFEKGLQNLQDSLITSKPLVSLGYVSSSSLPLQTSKKGNQNNNLHQLQNSTFENKLTGRETPNGVELSVEPTMDQKVADVSYCNGATIIAAVSPSRESNCSKGVSRGPQRCSRVTDSAIYFSPSKVLNGAERNSSSGLAAAEIDSLNLQVSEALVPCNTGEKVPKFSTAEGGSGSRSRVLDLPRKKDKTAKKKGNKDKFDGNHQDNKAVEVGGAENNLTTGLQNFYDIGETGALGKDLSRAISSLQVSSSGERDQLIPQRNAWVLCDDCEKWRRIPTTLADQIEETNRRWTCKDNTDKDFSDCSIPQEKSNAEINEELEISDASCEEDGYDTLQTSHQNRPKVAQQSSWTIIKSNLFLHRSRKKHAIDEVMVCHCKPPSDGRMGCGTECLNRMLNIECVRGTCPCGELCSNQQFQKRKYAKLKMFRCGKKGYGLQTKENISEGKFLIEYVGEVLDMRAYEARQKEYALNGHKHFYFMTLNGSEIIDACAKGNLGRYINHSCDPNCRTEKWMVNGEVCVGLFALRDIKEGEEVTFDYNYVRVFGAAAKKCVCGSPNCRGYIGGDPTSSEIIVQGDSDDEFTEPVVICEDREMKSVWQDIMSNTLNDRENKIANKPLRNRHRMKKQVSAVGHLECIEETQTLEPSTTTEGINSTTVDGSLKTLITPWVVESMVREENEADNAVGNDSSANVVGQSDISKVAGESLNGSASASLKIDVEGCLSQMHSSSQVMDVSLHSDGIMNKDVPLVQQEFSVGQKIMANSLSSAHDLEMATAVSPSKSLPNTIECKSKMKYASVGGKDEPGKSNSLSKAHRSSSSLKKRKPKANVLDNKGTPKQPELSLNSQSEAVEDKLNELLEPEGGISKRKDASKGYLKLLYLTAASGNNGHGEAIQSNRDLSMILDALLKTKSRTVLIDIINKNGLQMLHNIIKRYRKEFIKTPILRKLLKVLEYLAMRGILTLEHIARGPPYRGGESFTQAVLDLAEHNDKKVHQIARNFRDKWIPWSLRRNCCVERDDGRIESHQRSSYGRFPASHDLRSDRGGKPSETTDSREKKLATATGKDEASTVDHSASVSSCVTNRIRTRKRKSRWDNPAEESPHSRIKTNLGIDGKPNVDDDDAPPGFPSPCNAPVVLSNGSSVINQQERVVCETHQVSVILGELQQRFIARLPVSYGIPSSIMKKFGPPASWTTAPGVPFLPFPPLPSYDKGNPPTSGARCWSAGEPAENAEQVSDTIITHHAGQKHARTWGVDPPEVNATVANDRQDFQRPGGLGRKYFRQQKPNHSKLAPPWVRMRNGWGNNGRNGIGLGNGANGSWNSNNMEGANWRGEF